MARLASPSGTMARIHRATPGVADRRSAANTRFRREVHLVRIEVLTPVVVDALRWSAAVLARRIRDPEGPTARVLRRPRVRAQAPSARIVALLGNSCGRADSPTSGFLECLRTSLQDSTEHDRARDRAFRLVASLGAFELVR